MTARELIQKEWKRRENLINDDNFIKSCAEGSKELGITAQEWNENRAVILMMLANKFCRMEDEMKKNLQD